MIAEAINFKSLLNARDYYERNGYIYVESPWVVPAEFMNITRPESVATIKKDTFVASGEQSLLQMVAKELILPGLWQTLTPCYRPQDGKLGDDLHFSQFYKLELMWYKREEKPTEALVQIVTKMVLNYLGYYDLDTRIIELEDEKRAGCDTYYARDIEIQINGKWVEFGSYGMRFSEKLGYWIYGTGLAEPRFTYLLNKSK